MVVSNAEKTLRGHNVYGHMGRLRAYRSVNAPTTSREVVGIIIFVHGHKLVVRIVV